jgi:hypothetical protein
MSSAQQQQDAESRRVSGLAVASLGCGVLELAMMFGPLAYFGSFLFVLSLLAAFILGVAALIQIALSRGRLWGTAFAIGGILLSLGRIAIAGMVDSIGNVLP